MFSQLSLSEVEPGWNGDPTTVMQKYRRENSNPKKLKYKSKTHFNIHLYSICKHKSIRSMTSPPKKLAHLFNKKLQVSGEFDSKEHSSVSHSYYAFAFLICVWIIAFPFIKACFYLIALN